ncbi:hypothetical protein [Helicobacter labacensis]|nr:hypothetical protein [Helicobacter labacensis]
MRLKTHKQEALKRHIAYSFAVAKMGRKENADEYISARIFAI